VFRQSQAICCSVSQATFVGKLCLVVPVNRLGLTKTAAAREFSVSDRQSDLAIMGSPELQPVVPAA